MVQRLVRHGMGEDVGKLHAGAWSGLERTEQNDIRRRQGRKRHVPRRIDSNVHSAGESFVGYVRELENVVFLGTKTFGAMLAGNMGVCMLPNSELVLTWHRPHANISVGSRNTDAPMPWYGNMQRLLAMRGIATFPNSRTCLPASPFCRQLV